ncbi:dolichyl-P-Man:GDP-Man5GlcNAc2-PP-dolichyl alpha-1 3-mannosyltransferase putative (ALG3) [Leptomonas seymouri]|uniref:dolichyl-P-Man:Man5GlcNAc2-PP-dolichol alpha-1,3-mannosyltransferase n=1 Tax=Leptomonas seymouri TaxID=5684 RepID=A0A0N0P7A1_LEPSE|nr:dolichyl-P-Man:GDP-Man5GlcNAc2-PP-dolichyl alpha-1 3-mannosyltransferase putative (ALG3) [Leptomonas seymouri]|eukprot:KPI88566.1 dolichyl-P-Man:GDP-Man5GlcNAc2-PP-dolichyl alpha-1 3-mannosyltransferase putative (ALG3) [Leptomonas seymouri]
MRFGAAVLAAEAVLIAGIINYVPYTEIDWKAYMEEVSGFLYGQLDYRKLSGNTGPLIYPGGFLWVYSILYYITSLGEDIQFAQWIFAGVYLTTLALMLRFYTNAGLSWRVMLPLFFSKRIRSLYVLRLFNDCWAMLFLMVAVSLIAGGPARNGGRVRHWVLGCFFISFAVSIKMSVLLFVPGMLYVMLRTLPFFKLVGCLCVCVAWQVLAALPFLLHDSGAYISRGFELSSTFQQRWSVNYQFLDSELFVSPKFSIALLIATVAAWALVWRTRWANRTFLTSAEAKALRPVFRDVPQNTLAATIDDDEEMEKAEERRAYVAVVLTLFESNLIGVAFARPLHHQFYTWFFFTVPFLLSYTSYPRLLSLLAFVLIRQGFEQYPPTPQTSMLLQGGFVLALTGVIFFGRDTLSSPTKKSPKDRKSELKPLTKTDSAAAPPTKEAMHDGKQASPAKAAASTVRAKASKAKRGAPEPVAITAEKSFKKKK